MAEAAFCRICFESGEPSSFITPCRCRGDVHTGSQKHVHAACLSAWLRTSPQGSARCSVCQSAFYVRPSLFSFLVKLCCGSKYASCCGLVLAAICLAPIALCLLGFVVVFTLGCHVLGYRPELSRKEDRTQLVLLRTGRPLPSLRQGVLISATDRIDTGIFVNCRVLLVKYSPYEGAIGVILNRTFVDEGSQQELHLGGPVSQEAPRVLHTSAEVEGGYQVLEGVFLGGREQDLLEQEKVFVFYGYCLWRAKQLDGEVRAGLWRVEGPAAPEHIFPS